MKKNLTKINNEINNELYFYKSDEKIIIDKNDRATYPAHISGDPFGICGDISSIFGNVTGIFGNVTGIRGDVTGIRGNQDCCEISNEERENGIEIKDLLIIG